MTVLIVTQPNDYHAHAVKWAIERLGGSCELFYSLDICDGCEWAFDPAAEALCMNYKGKKALLDFVSFTSVWMRRPGRVYPQEAIADVRERAVSESETWLFANGVFHSIEARRFVVNHIDQTRRAGIKSFQLAAACRVGMPMPRTLVSNDKEAVIEFFHACDQRIVYKTMTPAIWADRNKNVLSIPTTMITDTALLHRADMVRSPSIFQEHIQKTAEVRVTIMGRSIFAWEKRFPTRTDLDVDWRFMYAHAEHKVHKLPNNITEKCFQLLGDLGLVFGCFDFVIDEQGQYYFLEVNPQGQWLWGDGLDIGLYQLEAMAEFLLSGDCEFEYSNNQSIKISDYAGDEFRRARERESQEHYGDLTMFFYERVSVPTLTPGTFGLAQRTDSASGNA